MDVGAARKGFDLALIDERRLLSLQSRLDRGAVLEAILHHQPALVAIDAPRTSAPPNHTARACERELSRRICGIRWTPDEARVRANRYYAWVVEGLALFEALAARGIDAIEVFPTAAWTRWVGPRGTRSRATWSAHGLARLGLDGLPLRTNQDQRDAIAAAVTARLHTQDMTESIGEIVVPCMAARHETPSAH